MTHDNANGAPTAKRNHKITGIRQWLEDERPRERLLSRGPHALTDAKLLAILLRPSDSLSSQTHAMRLEFDLDWRARIVLDSARQ